MRTSKNRKLIVSYAVLDNGEYQYRISDSIEGGGALVTCENLTSAADAMRDEIAEWLRLDTDEEEIQKKTSGEKQKPKESNGVNV